MRAAFQADLAARLDDIERLVGQLQGQHLSPQSAVSTALAHLHDIKGCGTPYGFPEATELARIWEAELKKPASSNVRLAAVLADLTRSFRKISI